MTEIERALEADCVRFLDFAFRVSPSPGGLTLEQRFELYAKWRAYELKKSRLEDRWDDQGDCRSCGWHAALYEYGEIGPDVVIWCEESVWLPCLSQDHDDSGSHRGICVYVGE